MKYKQLTLEKRYHISALIKAGLNQKEIVIKRAEAFKDVSVNMSEVTY